MPAMTSNVLIQLDSLNKRLHVLHTPFFVLPGIYTPASDAVSALLQVLSSLQKVLGAVRMQQQRAKSAVDQSASGMASESHSISQLRLQVVQAESAEATAQQAVRALQKKEVAWEAELGAAQISNAQLHTQACYWSIDNRDADLVHF